MNEETTDPLEQLYLHIFIASMVLIKDFYAEFGAVYAEPAQPEADLSVHFMGFFMHAVDTLAPEKQLPEKTAPLLADKIATELAAYGQDDIVAIKQTLLDTAQFYARQPTQSTTIGPQPVNALVSQICEVTAKDTQTYIAYAAERTRNILEQAVPFKELVQAVS